MAEKELIKKHKTALFIKDVDGEGVEEWVRVHHAPELVRNMNPEKEDVDYIGDEYPTTEVTGYKVGESLSVKTIKGNRDFDLVYKMYKARAVGPDAHRDVLTVSLFDEIQEGKYYSMVEDATITVNEYNASSSEISFDIDHNGTPTEGWTEIVDGKPVFHAGTPEASGGTDPDPNTDPDPSNP